MQVVGVGGISAPAAAAGKICIADLQHHGPGGCTDFRRAQTNGVRFPAGAEILPNFCRGKDHSARISPQRAWAPFTLLSAGLHTTQRVVLASAHDSRSDRAQWPENPNRDASKEWTRIPSTIYRPFRFPDIQEYARGLNSRQRISLAVGFLAVLALVAWVRNLGVGGLVDDTEPVFVEAARQMILSGDYITPKFNGLPRFEKPALIYWLVALSAKIFGDKVWAYRLPSCLLASGLLAGLYLTVLRFGLRLSSELNGSFQEKLSASSDNFLPAIIASGAFALNLGVMAWGSAAVSDMLVTTTVGASLLSFFWGYAGRDHSPLKYQNHYLISAAFLGLACLSSGPTVVLWPLCICTSFLLCTGGLKQVVVNELPVVKGLFIIGIINLPWYVMMHLRHGAMFWSNFSVEQFVRCLIQQHGVRRWWVGLAAVLIMYFPWCLSLPSALMKANPWKDSGNWIENYRSRKLVLFAAVWLVSGFGLAAFTASHLSSYLLVAPPIALLAAAHLSLPARLHENGVATGLAPALIYQILAGVFFLPGVQQGATAGMLATIRELVVSKHYHQIAFVILAAAGMLATRTEEYAVAYGSKHMSSEENVSGVAEHSVEGTTFLPLWVLHTVFMLALLGLVVTPCFRLLDSVRQAPVRELALKAAQLQQTGEELLMVEVKMPSVVYYSQLPTSFFDSFAEAANSWERSSVKPESVLVISSETWSSSLESTDLCQVEGYRLTRVILPTDQKTSKQE